MTSDERARFAVLLESIETKLGVIADGHEALNDKFDALASTVDGIASDIGIVKMRLDRIEHHVGLNGAPTRGGRTPAKPKSRKR